MPITFTKFLKNEYFLIILIVILGFGLRIINYSYLPFGGDEILSIDIAKHYQNNPREMIGYLDIVEVHPPLYYLLLSFWGKIFSFNEISARSISIIFGLLVIFSTYILSKKMFNKKIGLLSAFLVSVLPMQIEFSHQARPYIIFCFFAIISSLAYYQYIKTERYCYLFLYIIALTLGLYVHYSFIFFAATLIFFWFFRLIFIKDDPIKSKKIITWLAAHFLIFLLFYRQFIHLLYKFELSKILLLDTARSLKPFRDISFFEKILNQIIWSSKNLELQDIHIVGILIFKIVFISSILIFIYNKSNEIKNIIKNDGSKLLLLIILAFVPFILFIFSPQSYPYVTFYERHMIVSTIFIMIIFSYTLINFKNKLRIMLISLFIISLTNSYFLILGDDTKWDDSSRLKIYADHINNSYKPGDLVLINFSFTRTDLNHYLKNNINAYALYPINLFSYEFDYMATRETLGILENESQVRLESQLYLNSETARTMVNKKMNYLLKKNDASRIWMVFDEGSIFKEWFIKNRWKEVMPSLGNLFPVKLYEIR